MGFSWTFFYLHVVQERQSCESFKQIWLNVLLQIRDNCISHFPDIWLFHDGGLYHIEISLLICFASQRTGFYMIVASVMKELNHWYLLFTPRGDFSNYVIKLLVRVNIHFCKLFQWVRNNFRTKSNVYIGTGGEQIKQNRDIFRETHWANRRRIQIPAQHLRWRL